MSYYACLYVLVQKKDWQPMAHRPNMTCGLFFYSLQAKNVFHNFKELFLKKEKKEKDKWAIEPL